MNLYIMFQYCSSSKANHIPHSSSNASMTFPPAISPPDISPLKYHTKRENCKNINALNQSQKVVRNYVVEAICQSGELSSDRKSGPRLKSDPSFFKYHTIIVFLNDNYTE